MFLGVEARQTLKAVFVTLNAGTATERTALIMLRGDLDVSEKKVKQVTGVETIQQATEEEIRERIGATPGYASPIGIRENALVIVDESIYGMANFVTGANEADAHYTNANYPRDFTATMVADLALAKAGAGCPRCKGVLTVDPAAILGETTMRTLMASYLDASGAEYPVIMGKTRIDLDQVLCAIADLHHDEHGIRWPFHAAPLDVHIVSIAKSEEAGNAAEALYKELQTMGIGVSFDDRNLSPGVMFADADLIGLPLRITISPRSLENGGYEIKWRTEDERTILPAAGASSAICALLEGDQAALRPE
jgi:prolyl-tRNA synthetase